MGSGRITPFDDETFSGRLCAVRETLLWMLRLRTRHRVVNVSMAPTAAPGDYLLVNPKAYARSLPVAGDIIIARHPVDDVVITKRVEEVIRNEVRVASDNPEFGQDSRHFGPVPLSLLLGQVTCVIR